MSKMEGTALIRTSGSSRCADTVGVSKWDQHGQVGRGGDRVTGTASARLFRHFVDCLFRHHEPGALLLRVMESGEALL